MSLDRIILYVADVRTLVAFYRDALGLPLVEEIEDEWAVFQAGHCQLALHRAGAAFRGTGARLSSVNNNSKIVMTVDVDLEALREKLISIGVPMGAIKSYAGTGPLCDGTDPEGNVFQLARL